MGKNTIHKRPAQLAQLLFALWIPEQILAAFADGNIGMHAIAVYTHHRFRQEASSQTHVGRNLAAHQFVKLNLVGRSHHFPVSVIDFEL